MRIRLQCKQRAAASGSPTRASLLETGYTFVEVLVAAGILGFVGASLYAAFAAGFVVIQTTRENLRATQIMVQKLEAVRLFTWSQVNDSTNYLKPTFVERMIRWGTTTNQQRGALHGLPPGQPAPRGRPARGLSHEHAHDHRNALLDQLQQRQAHRADARDGNAGRAQRHAELHLGGSVNCQPARISSRARRAAGLTLLELMVSVALGSLFLAAASSLWLFSSRSFAAMTNYADLDAKSRNALDLMSRDIRQATQVIGFEHKPSTKSLTVTNGGQGTTITYKWSAGPRTLVCQKTGQPDQVYLTECDRWEFELFQRVPQKTGSCVFYPATNTAAAYDLDLCKLINMSWKCSRTILGSKVNTESVQTAQVVLRNKQ